LKILKLIGVGLFLLFFGMAWLIEHQSNDQSFIRKDVNALLLSKLEKKQSKQIQVLQHAELPKLLDQFDLSTETFQLLNKYQVALFAYKHNCLVFWSNQQIQPEEFKIDSNFQCQWLQNKNGWYQVVSAHVGDYNVYCYYTLYKQFPANNELFKNSFNQDLNLGLANWVNMPQWTPSEQSNFMRHIQLPKLQLSKQHTDQNQWLVQTLYVLAFIAFLLYLFQVCNLTQGFQIKQFMVLALLYLALFNAMMNAGWIWKSQASTISNEQTLQLGQLLMVLFALLALHQTVQGLSLKWLKPYAKLLQLILATLFWAINVWVVLRLLPAYIENSTVDFDFKWLSNIDGQTLMALFNVFLLFICLVVVYRLLTALLKTVYQAKEWFMSLILLGAIFIAYAYWVKHDNGFMLICLGVYGVIIPWWLIKIKKLLFSHFIILAVLVSGIFAVQFEQSNSKKEKESRKQYASELISKSDKALEYKLLNIEDEMIRAATIDSFFYYSKSDYEELTLNIKYNFFTPFIHAYDITLMRFDSMGRDVTPSKYSYSYLNALYNQSNNKSITNYFLYIRDLHYLGGYLAKYEICPSKRNIGYVFLLLTPKLKGNTYNLDYFFNGNNQQALLKQPYAYAIYQNNVLVKSVGDYPYQIINQLPLSTMEDEHFIEANAYSQLLKKLDNNTYLLVALKAPTWNQVFNVYTFILLYFTTLLLLLFGLIYLVIIAIGFLSFKPKFQKVYAAITQYFRVININRLYLETKIRAAFVLMSLFICSVVVYFTVQNVSASFKQNQNDNMSKKMASIVNELELGYNKRDDRPIQNLIQHLSITNDIDINMYMKDGTLYHSANSRIFNEGWFSPYMNPVANYELNYKKQFSYKQNESIGQLEYLSYYNALYDERRELIGFVNLPYFSKSLDLRNEFSMYLGSLLNITAVLLVISLLLSAYIGQSLVKPLKLMIDSLSHVQLGADNKPIVWQQKDEIGQLVDQYNSMLKQLELSTNKLAVSEREGAWKEMAQQVAHEIKNPLTPMKLHLQYLQMAIQKGDTNVAEKINEVSKILIEQIDHLSLMAEAFSSFAKMPVGSPEPCDIQALLQACVGLFGAQANMQIQMHTIKHDCVVMVDKSQVQRVFVNLLKNAQQAVKEGEVCKVDIQLEIDKDHLKVYFKDNGVGIDDTLKDKIFQPKFSTKNSGMGLGLAISRKVLEQVHGQISFESVLHQGTTFCVTLPLYKTT
jgi:signal transduction histidine kinase